MSVSTSIAGSRNARLVAAALGVAAWAAPGPASAQECDLETGEVLYIAGPDSMINVLRGIAAALWDEGTHVFYKGYPSCLGTTGIVNNAPTTPDPAELGTENAHAVSFWPGDPDVEMTCQLPFDAEDEDEPEIPADIALSDVFPTTCASFPNGLGSVNDFQGPALGFGFIVHPDSPAESISAEAAYLVFGFGAETNVVEPWTDTATILHRDPNSGTENIFAKTIRLDVDKWAGTSLNSTSVLLASVAEATGADVQTAIGGAGLSVLDQRRDELRVLPYQHYEQTCGYYPDSSPTALDKRNIRDGHYPIWGVVHILTRVDQGGLPVNPGANRFINLVLGTDEIAGLDAIALEAESGLIPQCAMNVIRDEDGGPLASYQPARSCGCYYESLVGETDCESCESSADCPDELPNCSYGYCEP
jgi:ABC-type phosphate transport system substrate-binding protein